MGSGARRLRLDNGNRLILQGNYAAAFGILQSSQNMVGGSGDSEARIALAGVLATLAEVGSDPTVPRSVASQYEGVLAVGGVAAKKDLARQWLRQVLAADPDRASEARARLWLGYLSLLDGNGTAAEKELARAVVLAPGMAEAHFNLGRALLLQGRTPEALAAFSRSRELRPDLWLTHLFEGRALSSLGRDEAAGVAFKRALFLGKERWVIYIYAAIHQARFGRPRVGLGMLEGMMRVDPDLEWCQPAPFGFYLESPNYRDYQAVAADYLRLVPSSIAQLAAIYLGLLQSGDLPATGVPIPPEPALRDIADTIRLRGLLVSPAASPLRVRALLLSSATPAAGEGYYRAALRGVALLRAGDSEGAGVEIESASRRGPESPLARYLFTHWLKRYSPETWHGAIGELPNYRAVSSPLLVEAGVVVPGID